MQLNSVVGVFSIVIEIAMIVLNTLPIYVGLWFKHRPDVTTTDELIIALSCSTISVVLFSTPFGLMSYFNHMSDGGLETCKLYQASTTWYQMFSILILSTMCFNKLHKGRVLTKLNYPPRVWSRRTTCVVIFLLFLLSLYVTILPVAGFVPATSGQSNATCHLWVSLDSTIPKEEVFYISYLTFGYSNILCVCMSLPVVFHFIRKVKRQMCIDGAIQDSNFIVERDIHRRAYVTSSRMVSLLVAMFYFSWIPILVMITILKLGYRISETAILYAMLGTSLTGLMNPLVYAFQDKTYRRGYRHALRQIAELCLCRRKDFRSMPALSMSYTAPVRTTSHVIEDTEEASGSMETEAPAVKVKVKGSFETPGPGTPRGVVNTACDDLEYVEGQGRETDHLCNHYPDSPITDTDQEYPDSALIGDLDMTMSSGHLDKDMTAIAEASLISSSSGSTSDASLESYNDDYYEESAM